MAEERRRILESESEISSKMGMSHGDCMKQMFTLQSTGKRPVVIIPVFFFFFNPLTSLHTEEKTNYWTGTRMEPPSAS
jgi:hypothetical protein